MQIEVFDPTGSTRVTTAYAARLDTLEGKTIGLLSNGHWQAGRTFPRLQQLLGARYPSARFVAVDGGYGIDQDEVIDGLVAAGCDGVIVGHAA